jgi:hypothetical protein
LKLVHSVSLGHGWVCSPGGSLVSGAKCPLLPPPSPVHFHCKKARSQVLPPPELPENGVRSPLTPPQRNTVYRFQKNATLGGWSHVFLCQNPHTQRQACKHTVAHMLHSSPPPTTHLHICLKVKRTHPIAGCAGSFPQTCHSRWWHHNMQGLHAIKGHTHTVVDVLPTGCSLALLATWHVSDACWCRPAPNSF